MKWSYIDASVDSVGPVYEAVGDPDPSVKQLIQLMTLNQHQWRWKQSKQMKVQIRVHNQFDVPIEAPVAD